MKNLDKILIQLVATLAAASYIYSMFFLWNFSEKGEVLGSWIGLIIIIAFNIAHLIHSIITWRR